MVYNLRNRKIQPKPCYNLVLVCYQKRSSTTDRIKAKSCQGFSHEQQLVQLLYCLGMGRVSIYLREFVEFVKDLQITLDKHYD